MVWRIFRVVALTLAVLAAANAALPMLGHSAEQRCQPAGIGPSDACLARLKQSFRRPETPSFPEDNPFSPAKSALGLALFFDPILSGGERRSCASCHLPALAWADGLPRATAHGGGHMALRTPTLLGTGALDVLGWDGKFSSLENVTFAPIIGRQNMNLDEDTALRRLAHIQGYRTAFAAAFGDDTVTRERVEQAIATFERTIRPGIAPFDHWVEGDDSAIGDSAKRGFVLFNGKANCAACHSGPDFTDGSFQDIGSATGDDIGRGRYFPRSVKLQYAFKTPSLRDAARRAPYMHDGRVATLDDVIALYDRGGIDRPSRSPHIKPLHLTDGEKQDLIAFLESLSSAPSEFPAPTLPR